jgi:hypothetical protein
MWGQMFLYEVPTSSEVHWSQSLGCLHCLHCVGRAGAMFYITWDEYRVQDCKADADTSARPWYALCETTKGCHIGSRAAVKINLWTCDTGYLFLEH